MLQKAKNMIAHVDSLEGTQLTPYQQCAKAHAMEEVITITRELRV